MKTIFSTCLTGDHVPADFFHPPASPHGSVNEVTAFVPVMPGRPMKDADQLHFVRSCEGAPWLCVKREVSDFMRRRHTDISATEIRRMIGLS